MAERANAVGFATARSLPRNVPMAASPAGRLFNSTSPAPTKILVSQSEICSRFEFGAYRSEASAAYSARALGTAKIKPIAAPRNDDPSMYNHHIRPAATFQLPCKRLTITAMIPPRHRVATDIATGAFPKLCEVPPCADHVAASMEGPYQREADISRASQI